MGLWFSMTKPQPTTFGRMSANPSSYGANLVETMQVSPSCSLAARKRVHPEVHSVLCTEISAHCLISGERHLLLFLCCESQFDLILELPFSSAVLFFPHACHSLMRLSDDRFTFTINAFFEHSLELLTRRRRPRPSL